jgi:hypothetical protein
MSIKRLFGLNFAMVLSGQIQEARSGSSVFLERCGVFMFFFCC